MVKTSYIFIENVFWTMQSIFFCLDVFLIRIFAYSQVVIETVSSIQFWNHDKVAESDLVKEGWIYTKIGIQWEIFSTKTIVNLLFFARPGHIPPIF